MNGITAHREGAGRFVVTVRTVHTGPAGQTEVVRSTSPESAIRHWAESRGLIVRGVERIPGGGARTTDTVIRREDAGAAFAELYAEYGDAYGSVPAVDMLRRAEEYARRDQSPWVNRAPAGVAVSA